MQTHSKSWRRPGEFLREILIIVVGVLIALSGQQPVDWIHQQNELAETREALREEIAQNSTILAQGAALDRCRFVLMKQGARRRSSAEARLSRFSVPELQRLGGGEIGSAFQDAGQRASELFPSL
jgi:hypothetical protein